MCGRSALADESFSELPSQPFPVVWVQVRRVIACRRGRRGEAIAFSRPREICVKSWHFRAQTGLSGSAYARLTAPENPCGNKRNPVADWIL
jgi:hypothetical protein